MSGKEIYAGEDEAGAVRSSGRRFVLVLAVSILLLFALTVWSLYAIFNSKLKRASPPPGSASFMHTATETDGYTRKIAALFRKPAGNN